jgi:hypothetical protein
LGIHGSNVKIWGHNTVIIRYFPIFVNIVNKTSDNIRFFPS